MAEEGVEAPPIPSRGRESPNENEPPINRNSNQSKLRELENSKIRKERKTTNATQESSRVAFAYFSFFTFHFQFIPIASSTFMVAPDVLFT